MIRLVKISKNEIQPLIEIAYKDDQKLLDEYHIAKFTHTYEAVLSMMGMINEMSEQRELFYYKVLCDKKPIGYVVTFDDFLYSFAINIKFRVKKILVEWWDKIIEVLGPRFICALYKNNTRAISFLEKCGMRIFHEHENFLTLIKF